MDLKERSRINSKVLKKRSRMNSKALREHSRTYGELSRDIVEPWLSCVPIKIPHSRLSRGENEEAAESGAIICVVVKLRVGGEFGVNDVSCLQLHDETSREIRHEAFTVFS